MSTSKIQILNQEDIQQKITRMVYQILEYFYQDDNLIIVGIDNGGTLLARLLQSGIEKESKLKTELRSFKIDKTNPLNTTDLRSPEFDQANILLVDDVANSGQTLMYALKPFLDVSPQKIKIAVLVDRKHKRYPIAADIVGETLSTSLQDNVIVTFDESGTPTGAFLSNITKE